MEKHGCGCGDTKEFLKGRDEMKKFGGTQGGRHGGDIEGTTYGTPGHGHGTGTVGTRSVETRGMGTFGGPGTEEYGDFKPSEGPTGGNERGNVNYGGTGIDREGTPGYNGAKGSPGPGAPSEGVRSAGGTQNEYYNTAAGKTGNTQFSGHDAGEDEFFGGSGSKTWTTGGNGKKNGGETWDKGHKTSPCK